MALKNTGDSAIGNALNALFPSKRYAPKRNVDSGCPTPPPGWDAEDAEGEKV